MAYADPVKALTRGNVAVRGPGSASFDGFTVESGDSVLLTNQNTQSENGVWIFAEVGKPMSRPGGQDQYALGNVLDNATLIPVTHGTTYAGTVWGIDPAKVVTVNTHPHTLGRVVLPPVQARWATTADINLANTFPIIDGRTVTDGAMANASTTLTCAISAPFKSSDVGKAIVVEDGAGAGTDLVTTISAFTSASQVTLAAACTNGAGVAGSNVEFGVKLVGLGVAGADIVLVKDQTTASENGLYWANTTGAMARCTEPLVPSRAVAVSEGDRNARTEWVCYAQGAIVLGTTDLPFVRKDANYGKTVIDMEDTDQDAPTGDGIIHVTNVGGDLSKAVKLTFPTPTDATTSYRKTVHNACTGARVILRTNDGTRTISLPPGCTSVVEFDENGAREIHGGVYDPRDFGCPWDGIHDDLPGLDAMMAVINGTKTSDGLLFDHTPAHIQLPRGKGYCSDNWHIAHPVHVIGHGWGHDDALSELENGIKFAPLKGIIVDSYYTQADYPDGMAGEGSLFRDVSIVSTQAIMTDPDVGSSRGLRSLDKDLDVRVASTFYPKGVCVFADGTSSTHGPAYLCEGATRTSSGGPLVMFRCTTEGFTAAAASGAETTAKAAMTAADIPDLGSTIPDDGVTWTVESIPKDYENGKAYSLGERVFLPGDPSCYFQCVEPGTSMAFSSFGGVSGSPYSGAGAGIGVSCNRYMIAPDYGGVFYDVGDLPVEMSLTALLRGSFAAIPWLGAVSRGTSGELTHAFDTAGADPTVGSTLNGHDAAAFDGTQYLQNTAGAELFLNTSAYRVLGWINASAASAPSGGGTTPKFDAAIISEDGGKWGITFTTDGVSVFHDDGAYKVASKACTTAGWHLFDVIYDGTNLTVYIDGVAGTPVAAGPLGTISGATVRLGINFDVTVGFVGEIVEIGIADGANALISTTDLVRDGEARYGLGAPLKWETHIPAGILFVAGVCTVDHCNISGFTGAGVYITDNINANVFHGHRTADGNHTAVRNCEIMYCGGGIKVFGGNSNGCIFDWINLDFLGLGRTNVDAAAYLNQSPERWGTGAYCVWDASLGGASVRHIYGQAFAGCPFRNDRVDAAGSDGIWLFCLAEVAEKSYFLNAPVVIQVFPTSDANQAVIIGAECSGFHFVDRTGTLMSAQVAGGGQLYQFSVTLDSPYIWGWVHDGTDWGLRYGGAQPHAVTLFGVQRGTDPGLGWMGFKRGFLIGDTDGLLFRGPLVSTGRPEGRMIDTNLRAGLRKTGDRFDAPGFTVTVTSDGYRGYPWTTGGNPVVPGNEPYGNPPTLVEPSANGDFPGAGKSVWKALGYGTTHDTDEPIWATAAPAGGTAIGDQIVDNDFTWELVGFTPGTTVEVYAASTTYDDDQALTLMDRWVTVTVDAKTVTLPANPFDGQMHDIKAVSGVTTTIDTDGGDLDIDGSSTASVVETNATFRYSAIAGQWELR
jgi:hypothetical protein